MREQPASDMVVRKSIESMDHAELRKAGETVKNLINDLKKYPAISEDFQKKMLAELEAELSRINRRIEVLTLTYEVTEAVREIDGHEYIRDETKKKLKKALMQTLNDNTERNLDNVLSEVLEKNIGVLGNRLDWRWANWLGENNIKTVRDLLTALKLMKDVKNLANVGNAAKAKLREGLIIIGVPEAVISTITALN